MKLVDGKLVLEPKDCSACRHYPWGPGKQAGKMPCHVCDGTGRGKRGKPQGCRQCFGYGTEPDFDNLVPCAVCKGNYRNAEVESWTDRVPDEVLAALPIRVDRSPRRMSAIETVLGAGLGSCVDYGRAWVKSDAKVIASLSLRHLCLRYVQACNIVRSKDDLTLCDGLVVALTPQGYSVLPEWRR